MTTTRSNDFLSIDSRSYVVGLPVVVTVSPEGFVTVEVDLSETTSVMHEGESQLGEYSYDEVSKDAAVVSQWMDTHTVKNEGFAG